MARKATWQRHTGPRSAYAAYTYTYILHIIYSKGIQPSVYRKGIQHTNPSGVINPTCFTNFFHVRLSPTQLFSFPATWVTEERWIGGASEIRSSIAWTHGPSILDQARV